MSLVSTYALASDGRYYANPVLRDAEHRWFVCWDDNDPTELVMRGRATVDDARLLLSAKGITASIDSGPKRGGQRCFGKIEHNPFHAATSFFITVIAPIPQTLILDHDGSITLEQCSKREGCFDSCGTNDFQDGCGWSSDDIAAIEGCFEE